MQVFAGLRAMLAGFCSLWQHRLPLGHISRSSGSCWPDYVRSGRPYLRCCKYPTRFVNDCYRPFCYWLVVSDHRTQLFPWAAVLDFPNMWLSMGVAVILALPGLLVYSSSVRGQQFGYAWLTVAAVILIVSCAVHMFFASLLVAVLMIADILQRVSADQRLNQPHAIPVSNSRQIVSWYLKWTRVAFVLVMSAFIMVGLQLNQGSLRLITFPPLIVSVLFTSLLILSWMRPLQKVLTPIHRFRILPEADLSFMIALPFLAIAWSVIRGQITTALLLAGILVLSRLPKWIGVVAIGVGLCLFALPTPASLHLDDFHDGQILTEVWQYRSGRPLFSSVYPLRMFEFGCAFLADMIKPLTPSWYLLSQRIAKPIGMLGTLLLMFSWPQLFPRSREPLAPSIDESSQSRGGLMKSQAPLSRSRARHSCWRVFWLVYVSAGPGATKVWHTVVAVCAA